jgi:hypothetical protein
VVAQYRLARRQTDFLLQTVKQVKPRILFFLGAVAVVDGAPRCCARRPWRERPHNFGHDLFDFRLVEICRASAFQVRSAFRAQLIALTKNKSSAPVCSCR